MYVVILALACPINPSILDNVLCTIALDLSNPELRVLKTASSDFI